MVNTFNFINEKNKSLVYTDVYGSVLGLRKKFASDLDSALSQANSGKGKITLSNGMDVDMTTTSGMTVFSSWLNQLNGYTNFVEGTFDFVKKYEKSFQNIISGA